LAPFFLQSRPFFRVLISALFGAIPEIEVDIAEVLDV
jgi:hypothetical protein